MHLRREIDGLLDKSNEIKEKLDAGDSLKKETDKLTAQLQQIKDKIKELTENGRGKGLWTDSPEFLAQWIF